VNLFDELNIECVLIIVSAVVVFDVAGGGITI